jgi:hypothetical protein
MIAAVANSERNSAGSPSASNCPWYRFSLADLFLLVTAACIQAALLRMHVVAGLMMGWVVVISALVLWFWIRNGLLRQGVLPTSAESWRLGFDAFALAVVYSPAWFVRQFFWFIIAMIITLPLMAPMPARLWWLDSLLLTIIFVVVYVPPWLFHLAHLKRMAPNCVRDALARRIALPINTASTP